MTILSQRRQFSNRNFTKCANHDFPVESEYLNQYIGGRVLDELSMILGRCRDIYFHQSDTVGSRSCLCEAEGARV
jgi:hypothetical protein